ncbi:MAG: hypothetical protein EAX96_19995 [Candidatus Lokiarchaeota archaeon]|nr:hypothetical protein [Candidatus Lokiarchaeota archaeon]
MLYKLIIFMILLIIYVIYIIHTILKWTIPVWKEKQYFETYASFGMMGFIGIILLEFLYWVFTGFQTTLTIKFTAYFAFLPITSILELIALIIGWCLWIIGISFIVGSFLRLKLEGEPTDDWELTTIFVDKFPFSIVRHPMFCGASLIAISFILFFLTFLSIILGILTVIFLYLASIGEDNFDKKKFPREYDEYLKRVPRWNFILGFLKKIRN